MEDRKTQSLRRAAGIATTKSKDCKCIRRDKCLPHFGIKSSSEAEKGERIVREKILGNV